MHGISVVSVPARPIAFGLCCKNGSTIRMLRDNRGVPTGISPLPMSSAAPYFHGVRVSGLMYSGTHQTLFFGNVPRVPVSNVALRGLSVASRVKTRFVCDHGVALGGIAVRGGRNRGFVVHFYRKIDRVIGWSALCVGAYDAGEKKVPCFYVVGDVARGGWVCAVGGLAYLVKMFLSIVDFGIATRATGVPSFP